MLGVQLTPRNPRGKADEQLLDAPSQVVHVLLVDRQSAYNEVLGLSRSRFVQVEEVHVSEFKLRATRQAV